MWIIRHIKTGCILHEEENDYQKACQIMAVCKQFGIPVQLSGWSESDPLMSRFFPAREATKKLIKALK